MAVEQESEEAATTTSIKRIVELAAHPSKKVRCAVADNPEASDQVIMMLAHDDVEIVRLSAASAASGRPALHEALSNSEEKWVRAILAHSAAIDMTNQLPRDVQLRFARDEFREVRERIAHTTEFLEVFELLLLDPDARVRGYCAINPRITESQMDRLVTDRSWMARASSTSGLRYPRDEQLIALATDKSEKVRWLALARIDTPTEVIGLALNDPSQHIRDEAKRILARRKDPPSERTLSIRIERELAAALSFR